MKILIFRIGQLGDTIVALPAIWAVRQHFSAAKLTLLCDQHPGKSYVLATDLLRNSGLLDSFESYPVYGARRTPVLRALDAGSLLLRLRLQKYDAVVYL